MTGIMYLQGGLALILQVFLLQALVRHGGRRYFILTLYIVSLFLGTIVVISSLSGSPGWSNSARRYFWTSELIQQVLVFCTILSFIHQHLSSAASRAKMARWLVPASVLILMFSLWIHYDPKITKWMTSVSRDLSFAATGLNLMLWTVLLQQRERSARLLIVSGGLGIMMAGAAMGQGLRELWQQWRGFAYAGNIVISISYLVSLYVLYRAFSRSEAPLAAEPPRGVN